MTRIACLYVPLFPLAARLRSEPELAGEIVAICEGNGSAAKVVAASRPARKAGIRPGMSMAQARGILPAILARGRDPGCEASAHEALLETAWSISPRVEDAELDLVFADVDGMDNLYDGEHDIGQAAEVTATSMALPIRVGIAANKLAARIAARQPGSPTVVPAGGEVGFLAALPLRHLRLDRRLAETLGRWGVTTLGGLARLPADRVASRLGPAGAAAHQAARGIDPQPLVPHQPPPTLTEGMELEWPVVTVNPLLAAVRQCLDRIRQRLEAHDLACALLEIELGLEPEGSTRRAVRLPAPTRDVDALVALIRLELEAHPPAAAVAAFACFVHPNKPRRGQMTLFGAPEIHPEKLAATMARIAGRIGPDRVGAPQVSDGHLPERYDTGVFDPPPAPKLRREPKNGRGLLAVRVLRPPVPLEVIVEEISCPQNKPVTLSEPTSASSGPHPPVTLSEPRRGASRRVSSGSEDHPSSQPSTGPGSDSPTRRGSFDSAASEAAPLRMTDSGTPVPFDPGPVPDPERTAERERQQSLHDKQQAPGRAGNPASSIQHPASAPPPCDELSTVDCRLSTLRLVSVTSETGATPRIQGLIRVAAGPWSLEDGWWSDRPVQRDYWDIELSGGRLYRIFRDRSSGDWFADGMYD